MDRGVINVPSARSIVVQVHQHLLQTSSRSGELQRQTNVGGQVSKHHVAYLSWPWVPACQSRFSSEPEMFLLELARTSLQLMGT